MPSLTSLLPRISAPLGLTTAALYERQRALVRIGLLPSPQGRGKGSGAKALPETVALLIISRLLTDNLSDADERVAKLANARFVDRKRKSCRWTGARNFKDAVASLLCAEAPGADPANSTTITVWRRKPSAVIQILPTLEGASCFGSLSPTGHEDYYHVVQVSAELPDDALRTIRSELTHHVKSERE